MWVSTQQELRAVNGFRKWLNLGKQTDCVQVESPRCGSPVFIGLSLHIGSLVALFEILRNAHFTSHSCKRTSQKCSRIWTACSLPARAHCSAGTYWGQFVANSQSGKEDGWLLQKWKLLCWLTTKEFKNKSWRQFCYLIRSSSFSPCMQLCSVQ